MTDLPDPSPWQKPPVPGSSPGDTDDMVRGRQRGRAIVMAALLGALVVLIFFVTIAKIKAGMK